MVPVLCSSQIFHLKFKISEHNFRKSKSAYYSCILAAVCLWTVAWYRCYCAVLFKNSTSEIRFGPPVCPWMAVIWAIMGRLGSEIPCTEQTELLYSLWSLWWPIIAITDEYTIVFISASSLHPLTNKERRSEDLLMEGNKWMDQQQIYGEGVYLAVGFYLTLSSNVCDLDINPFSFCTLFVQYDLYNKCAVSNAPIPRYMS